MLAEDSDPAVHFSMESYLIGVNIHISRAAFLQSASDLIARAETDSLPGFKTPESIQSVRDLLAAYIASETNQQDAIREKELSRLNRDELLARINIPAVPSSSTPPIPSGPPPTKSTAPSEKPSNSP